MQNKQLNYKRRQFLKQIIATTALGAITSCCAYADNLEHLPDLGDSDRTNLSPFQADLLGRQVVLDIYSQGSMVDDYDCLDYLNNLGNNLVSFSSLAGQNFNFYLIKEHEINAFALPGGYICAYNGLIYHTLTEAELASVLAHEIGHVVQHHIFRNLSVQNRAQWTSLAGVLAGALLAPLNPAAAMLALNSGQGLAIQNSLAFSRDYEREADRVGQQLLYQTGFDAHAMPEFFQRLQDTYKFNQNDALAFLQTHPVTLERLSEAETRANQLPTKMRTDSISFLLVREKCRQRQLGNEDAIKFYLQALTTKRYVSIEAQYYGLAWSYFLAQKINDSLLYLNKITGSEYLNHPIIIGLRANLLIAKRNFVLANKLYDQALISYPNHKGLWMGQLQFLLQSKNYGKMITRLSELIAIIPSDPDVWDQYAIVYADDKLNNPICYHYGLGNEFYLLANYPLALTHYQAALTIKTKQTSDRNIQDLITSKINDVKRQMALIKNLA
ncbi:MAG: hypothetical protein RLZZ293_750 [Pseudomonadota bacterium]|jgi:predicted Zn-dependent protease